MTTAPVPAAQGTARQPRAEATRRALLDAALAVFTEQGYSNTSIAEVVRRADASVGSLYHHFGGKVDLFLALWEEYRREREQIAAHAVAQRRAHGETDPYALFLVGAEVYLRECWRQREIAKLFLTGDGPPGFELLRRESTQWWQRQNAVLLKTQPRPLDRAFVIVLTTTTGEVAREIVYSRTARAARELRQAALAVLSQICALHSRGLLDPATAHHPATTHKPAATRGGVR
jgi:AcrR family transcriptional regulator